MSEKNTENLNEEGNPSSPSLCSGASHQGEAEGAKASGSTLSKGEAEREKAEAESAEAAAAKPVSGKKKALNIIVDVIIAIVLIFVVFMTVSIIRSAGKDYTEFFGYTYLGVETNSMDGDEEDSDGYVGSFGKGALLTIRILDENERLELQVGDVVTFYETVNNVRIINSHRIISLGVRMDGIQYYKTQGDNPEAAPDDFTLTSSNVIGIVEGHVEGIGNVVLWVNSSAGFFVCVVLPSFALVVYCVINLILTMRARNKVSDAEKEEAMRQKILDEMAEKEAAEAAETEAEKEAEMRKKILAEMGLNEDGSKKE